MRGLAATSRTPLNEPSDIPTNQILGMRPCPVASTEEPSISSPVAAVKTPLAQPLGLLSEDYDTSTGLMAGNFPQAYSHVGFIRGAFSAAPRWLEVL